jgi:hypothetical protein
MRRLEYRIIESKTLGVAQGRGAEVWAEVWAEGGGPGSGGGGGRRARPRGGGGFSSLMK